MCFDFGKTYKAYDNIRVSRIRLPKKTKGLLVLLSTNFSFYEFLWERNTAAFIQKSQLDALHVHDLYLAKAARKGIEKTELSIPLTLDLHENYPTAINSYQWTTKGWRKHIVQPQK